MVESSKEYSLRAYREEDERALVRLFNEVYSNYAGFAPRTTEYWRWCCLTRPGVERKSICIMERSGEIVGYAVVTIDSSSGKVQAKVLEFCCSNVEGESGIRHLMQWIIDYAGNKEADSVSLFAPTDSEVIHRVFGDFGFSQFPLAQTDIRIVDCTQLIREIVASRSVMLTGRNEVFNIYLLNAPTSDNASLSICIESGKIKVASEISNNPTIKMNADTVTLASCILGSTNIYNAVCTRRIKVNPFWKLPKVAALFSALQLNDVWFIPTGDFG